MVISKATASFFFSLACTALTLLTICSNTSVLGADYSGRMINSHMHVLGNVEEDLMLRELSGANAEAAVLLPKFYRGGGPYGGKDLPASDQQVQALVDNHPKKFFPLIGLQRGELCNEGAWSDARSIQSLVEEFDQKLSTGNYFGAGELIVVHWSYGKHAESTSKNKNCSELSHDISSPLVEALLAVLKKYDKPLVIHMEGDPISVSRLKRALDLGGKIVWAHNCGRSNPLVIRKMLSSHLNLFCDLANMDDKGFYGSGKPRLAEFSYLIMKDGVLDNDQRQLMIDYSDRFLVGSDVAHTEGFRNKRVSKNLQRMRMMLGQLPPEVAERAAFRNAIDIFGLPLKTN